MNSPNPSALDLAIAKAAENHVASEKALAHARTRLKSAESTFTTLDRYRGEYAGRLRDITQVSKDALGNYHRFLGKLSLALDSQKHDVDHAGRVVEEQKRGWIATLQRLKAMELLRNRRAAIAQNHLKRQEQKQSDEFAARSARRFQRHACYE